MEVDAGEKGKSDYSVKIPSLFQETARVNNKDKGRN